MVLGSIGVVESDPGFRFGTLLRVLEDTGETWFLITVSNYAGDARFQDERYSL